MIDILFYLFEHYLPDACPEPAALARKLIAAGFEDDDVSQAIDWLAGFDAAAAASPALALSRSVRLYHDSEITRLPAECRGFLAFLEQAEAIDATARELILERALALPDEVIALNKLKGIVLMVVWRQQLPLDALVLEELLEDEIDDEDASEQGVPAGRSQFH
jgi:Smg protein